MTLYLTPRFLKKFGFILLGKEITEYSYHYFQTTRHLTGLTKMMKIFVTQPQPVEFTPFRNKEDYNS